MPLGRVGILTFPVVAVGVVPNSELADYSMEIDRTNSGIVVNPELQARADVYVVCSKFLALRNVNFSNTFCVCSLARARWCIFKAGDAASYYDIAANLRKQLCYYDHAIASGRLAALNMLTPGKKPYTHQPMFWCVRHVSAPWRGPSCLIVLIVSVAVEQVRHWRRACAGRWRDRLASPYGRRLASSRRTY